jgi:signal peptidase II
MLIIVGLLFYYTRYEYPKNSRYIDIAYGFIFSGALSHTYERIFVGYVVDFISVKYFAILNFADIFISV